MLNLKYIMLALFALCAIINEATAEYYPDYAGGTTPDPRSFGNVGGPSKIAFYFHLAVGHLLILGFLLSFKLLKRMVDHMSQLDKLNQLNQLSQPNQLLSHLNQLDVVNILNVLFSSLI
jgi:hypothetical protein